MEVDKVIKVTCMTSRIKKACRLINASRYIESNDTLSYEIKLNAYTLTFQINWSSSLMIFKLMKTMPEGQKQVVEQDFDGFKRLFGKFINSTGPSVHWDKIEKLPEDAVRVLYYLYFVFNCCCFRFILMQTYHIQMTKSQFARCLTNWW